ncbi:MAG: cell division protein FtsQ/DivIB [Planctomycetota bacterium]
MPRKKTAGRGKAGKETKTTSRFSAALARRIASFAGVLLVGLGRAAPMLLLVGALAWGGATLWRSALADPAYRLDARALRTMAESADLPAGARAELHRLAETAAGRSLLDPHLPAELRDAYAASPWVAKTFPFRRQLADRAVVADILLRMPAAQVYRDGHYYTVDETGALLPTAAGDRPDTALPLIRCRLAEPPAPGAAWPSEELHDALGVLRTLRRSSLASRLEILQVTVDRSGFIDRSLRRRQTPPRIALHTANGAVIHWGAYNRDEDTDRPLPREKVERLRRVLGEDRRLGRGQEVNVSTRAVTVTSGALTSP